jgi:hypothetical protein
MSAFFFARKLVDRQHAASDEGNGGRKDSVPDRRRWKKYFIDAVPD